MLIVVAGVFLIVQPVSGRDGPPKFKTNDQKLLYLWGATIGNEVAVAGVTDTKELEWISRGLRDRVAGQSPAFATDEQSQLYDYLMSRLEKTAVTEEKHSLAFVREKAKEPNALVTDSGLVYRELLRGDGAQPAKDSKVKVEYVGTLRNGWVFDSSRQRGAPLETSLTEVIGCWKEAIPMMKVGGKAVITCPPKLGYGYGGTPTIPPNSALSFDVELLEVDK
ncbi:MAG: FKBP-type peptidyl-prolyl cis-trans isomerase, partial [Gemmatimonadota bacterium]|nr:FKBP-type peptidyl-prolyl cis-trans isomerase [Gemmatimonadota bacterium]